MFIKFAKAKISGFDTPPRGKVASDSKRRLGGFEYQPNDDGGKYLYVAVRACTADVPNLNFDMLPDKELKTAYKTFKGAAVYLNHKNSDPHDARGAIIDATYHTEDPDDKWIEILEELDEERCPKLCSLIRSGEIDTVSMGCEVADTTCSVCGNVAEYPFEYCEHIQQKGRDFNGKVAYEICNGIKFFECSWVYDPADPTATVQALQKEGSRKVAQYIDWHEIPEYPEWAENEQGTVMQTWSLKLNRYVTVRQWGYPAGDWSVASSLDWNYLDDFISSSQGFSSKEKALAAAIEYCETGDFPGLDKISQHIGYDVALPPLVDWDTTNLGGDVQYDIRLSDDITVNIKQGEFGQLDQYHAWVTYGGSLGYTISPSSPDFSSAEEAYNWLSDIWDDMFADFDADSYQFWASKDAARDFGSDNFYIQTAVDWKSCATPVGSPDFVSSSGSEYWYFPDGVVRRSDHWGRSIGSCEWMLDGGRYQGFGEAKCGYAPWYEFSNTGNRDYLINCYVDKALDEARKYDMPVSDAIFGPAGWRHNEFNDEVMDVAQELSLVAASKTAEEVGSWYSYNNIWYYEGYMDGDRVVGMVIPPREGLYVALYRNIVTGEEVELGSFEDFELAKSFVEGCLSSSKFFASFSFASFNDFINDYNAVGIDFFNSWDELAAKTFSYMTESLGHEPDDEEYADMLAELSEHYGLSAYAEALPDIRSSYLAHGETSHRKSGYRTFLDDLALLDEYGYVEDNMERFVRSVAWQNGPEESGVTNAVIFETRPGIWRGEISFSDYDGTIPPIDSDDVLIVIDALEKFFTYGISASRQTTADYILDYDSQHNFGLPERVTEQELKDTLISSGMFDEWRDYETWARGEDILRDYGEPTVEDWISDMEQHDFIKRTDKSKRAQQSEWTDVTNMFSDRCTDPEYLRATGWQQQDIDAGLCDFHEMKKDNGLLGIVAYMAGGSWAWDTYLPQPGMVFGVGIDCGTCSSKEEAERACEQALAHPSYIASKKSAGYQYCRTYHELNPYGDEIECNVNYDGEIAFGIEPNEADLHDIVQEAVSHIDDIYNENGIEFDSGRFRCLMWYFKDSNFIEIDVIGKVRGAAKWAQWNAVPANYDEIYTTILRDMTQTPVGFRGDAPVNEDDEQIAFPYGECYYNINTTSSFYGYQFDWNATFHIHIEEGHGFPEKQENHFGVSMSGIDGQTYGEDDEFTAWLLESCRVNGGGLSYWKDGEARNDIVEYVADKIAWAIKDYVDYWNTMGMTANHRQSNKYNDKIPDLHDDFIPLFGAESKIPALFCDPIQLQAEEGGESYHAQMDNWELWICKTKYEEWRWAIRDINDGHVIFEGPRGRTDIVYAYLDMSTKLEEMLASHKQSNKEDKDSEPVDSYANDARIPNEIPNNDNSDPCPLCGNSNFDGVFCDVCGYEVPPEGFDDIDLESDEDYEGYETEAEDSKDEEKKPDTSDSDTEDKGEEEDADKVDKADKKEAFSFTTPYSIYQIRDNGHDNSYKWMDWNFAQQHGFDMDDYDLVYTGLLDKDYDSSIAALNAIYRELNVNHPADYTGHSLSVSDVVFIDDAYWYVDDIGFARVANHKESSKESAVEKMYDITDDPAYWMELCDQEGFGEDYELMGFDVLVTSHSQLQEILEAEGAVEL